MRILIASLLLAGCAQAERATGFVDEQIYPTLRVTACALSPSLRNLRQAERYEASGVVVIADCDWRPGDTLEDFDRRVMERVERL